MDLHGLQMCSFMWLTLNNFHTNDMFACVLLCVKPVHLYLKSLLRKCISYFSADHGPQWQQAHSTQLWQQQSAVTGSWEWQQTFCKQQQWGYSELGSHHRAAEEAQDSSHPSPSSTEITEVKTNDDVTPDNNHNSHNARNNHFLVRLLDRRGGTVLHAWRIHRLHPGL